MGKKPDSDPVTTIFGWIEKQPRKTKIGLGISVALACLIAFQILRSFHYHTYLLAEVAHAAGIGVLIYKLHSKKSCSGLSLKAQELTAIHMLVRTYCGFHAHLDIHTGFSFIKLFPTLWIIYMMRFKLNSTYNKDLDTLPLYYVLVPVAVLAIIVNPYSKVLGSFESTLWAFCVYLNAVLVLPQLRLMQNAKMAEPYTSHYVFALGIERFLSCAYWIIMIIENGVGFLFFWGYGSMWFTMNLIAQIIQTFILADFVYYYVKRVMAGQLLVFLPV